MRRPLLHFLIIGSACFLVSRWWSEESPVQPDRSVQSTIVISDATIAQLTNGWISRFGSAPTALERQAMIDASINDEILHREALRLDMHLADPVVDMRLTQNMRFLVDGEGAEVPGDEVLLRQALELDMAHTDIVVRRRLIQQMESVLEAAAVPPSLQESRDYVRRHPDRFAASPRYEISYRFHRHGETAERTARLYSGGFSPKKLALDFGPTGAEQIASLATGEWTGPILRHDGIYHVRLDDIIPPLPIEFERVRQRAQHAVMRERRQAALHRALQQLRGLYRIRVGGAPAGLSGAI